MAATGRHLSAGAASPGIRRTDEKGAGNGPGRRQQRPVPGGHLDELVVALHFGLVQWEDVCALIDGKAPGVELVLTGAGRPAGTD